MRPTKWIVPGLAIVGGWVVVMWAWNQWGPGSQG
jgi:hypothetical protein